MAAVFRPEPRLRLDVVAYGEGDAGVACLRRLAGGLDRDAPCEIVLHAAAVGPVAALGAAAPAAGGPSRASAPVPAADPSAGASAALVPAGSVSAASISAAPTWAAAVNAAVTGGSAPYVALLDGAATPEPGALGALLATAERRRGCGIVAGRTLGADGAALEAGPLLWSDGTWDRLGGAERSPYDYERRIDAAAGALLLVRREVWDAAGGIDGAYHPRTGPELVDLCLRAAELGWATWYQPAAVAVTIDEPRDTVELGPLLAERWAEVLATRQAPGRWEQAVWHAEGEPLRALVIDDEVSDPTRGSGYGRMHQTLGALDEATDIQVTFHPRIPPGGRPLSALAELEGPRARIVTDLDGHLASDDVGYDVVVVSRPPNAEIFRPLLDRRLPTVPVVYDAEALFFRRLERQLEVATPAERPVLEESAARMKATEASVAAWADRVVTISEDEAEAMRAFTSAPVQVVGPRMRSAHATAEGFDERSGACLVAGWAAGAGSPNADGLRWFAREVLPRVRAALPSFLLTVTGERPPADVTWAGGAAVAFVGLVPDLQEVYGRARVAVSCTRFGAGVKIKTVEAVMHGVPVVGTADAAAGLTDELAAAVWVGADAAGFADALITLLSDRRAWERYRRAALSAAADEAATPGTEIWPDIVRAARAAGKRPRRSG